jgi:hypothetical protein
MAPSGREAMKIGSVVRHKDRLIPMTVLKFKSVVGKLKVFCGWFEGEDYHGRWFSGKNLEVLK